MLKTLTVAPVTDLVELSYVKSLLDIDDTSQDAVLGLVITGITSDVHRLFGRVLARQKYEENPRRNVTRSWIATLRCNPIDPDQITVDEDGTTLVLDTDFWVEDAQAARIYRKTSTWLTSPEHPTKVQYFGGFLLPRTSTAKGVVSTWVASTAHVAGSWVRPTPSNLNILRYECTTGGTTGSSEPTWPTTPGGTVPDGTVTWTARTAFEIDDKFLQLTALAIRDRLDSLTITTGLITSEGEGFRETYSQVGRSSGPLAGDVLSGFEQLRAEYGVH